MKKIALALSGLLMLAFSSTSFGIEAKGWRIVFEQTIENDTKAVVAEVEWLANVVYPIDAVVAGASGTFAFENTGVGDVTDQFPADSTFTVSDSTGNDATYTVASVAYDSGTNVTTITVTGTIADLAADGSATTDDRVDISRPNTNTSACSWTRDVSNLDSDGDGMNDTQVAKAVSCDSISTDQRPDDSTTIPSGVRRTRLMQKAFDNSFSSWFKTERAIGANGTWTVQYTFYIGSSAVGRTLQDVEAYSVTVPTEYIGPSDNGLAPNTWRIEYLSSSSGRWVNFEGAEEFTANFSDGVDVDDEGDETGDANFGSAVGKKLTFTL